MIPDINRDAMFLRPQTGHSLSGTSYPVDGDGKATVPASIPNAWDRVSLLVSWVERGVAPGISEMVMAGERSLPLCAYPTYPKYVSGPVTVASSYTCAAP